MTYVIAQISDLPLATGFGAAGLAAQLAWPLFRRRSAMLSLQLGAACSYAVSYGLLGQVTATALCLTGAVQTSVALLAGDRPFLKRMGYVFLPVVLGLGILTYAGLPTLCAVAACCLVMIGRLQADVIWMRRVQLGASPFGATHDLLASAWPNLAGACVSFAIALAALRREERARRSRMNPA